MRSGAKSAQHGGAESARRRLSSCPIIQTGLTPAKCDMAVVVDEWLGGAGAAQGHGPR